MNKENINEVRNQQQQQQNNEYRDIRNLGQKIKLQT